MVITSGKVVNPLADLSAGGRATWFIAATDPVTPSKTRAMTGSVGEGCIHFIGAAAWRGDP